MLVLVAQTTTYPFRIWKHTIYKTLKPEQETMYCPSNNGQTSYSLLIPSMKGSTEVKNVLA